MWVKNSLLLPRESYRVIKSGISVSTTSSLLLFLLFTTSTKTRNMMMVGCLFLRFFLFFFFRLLLVLGSPYSAAVFGRLWTGSFSFLLLSCSQFLVRKGRDSSSWNSVLERLDGKELQCFGKYLPGLFLSIGYLLSFHLDCCSVARCSWWAVLHESRFASIY